MLFLLISVGEQVVLSFQIQRLVVDIACRNEWSLNNIVNSYQTGKEFEAGH